MNELDKLYKFMKKYRVYSKNSFLTYTHTLTYVPYGTFNIFIDDYDEFKKLYGDAIIAGYKTHITEKHTDFGPIIIDFDFLQSNKERCYTKSTIIRIIELYNKIIIEHLEIASDEILAYVMEKKQPTLKRDKYYDGLHIVYPYICTRPSIQLMMREKFIKLAEKCKLFREMSFKNSLEKIFDKAVIYKAGWMMYGSSKNPMSYLYYVTYVYYYNRFDEVEVEDIDDKRIRYFIDVMSCRRFCEENLTPLKNHLLIADNQRIPIKNLKNLSIEI